MRLKAVLSVLLGGALSLAGGQEDVEYKEKIVMDHSYYEMHLYKHNADGSYDHNHVDMTDSHVHEFLSNHSQAAEAVAPGFDFPFYGHVVSKFYITTHGFLSFAPRLHNLMYKTQYIAPLRVKLDPARSDDATINYLSQPDRLTIEWRNVRVAKPYEHPNGGNFTFQCTLHSNGDIVFVYVTVPDLLSADALYDDEPVAGLSDAFLIGDSELHVYHTLNVKNPDVLSETVVVFKAKPTCIRQQNCQDCNKLRKTSEFDCAWCDSVHRCSDGADRLREHWESNGCATKNVSGDGQCGLVESEDHTQWRTSMVKSAKDLSKETNETPLSEPQSESTASEAGSVASVVISTLLVLVLLVIAGGFLFVYGKRNPGGVAERIAMRMETSYKKFGDQIGSSDSGGGLDGHQGREFSNVDLENKHVVGDNNNDKESAATGNNNNGSVTISF